MRRRDFISNEDPRNCSASADFRSTDDRLDDAPVSSQIEPQTRGTAHTLVCDDSAGHAAWVRRLQPMTHAVSREPVRLDRLVWYRARVSSRPRSALKDDALAKAPIVTNSASVPKVTQERIRPFDGFEIRSHSRTPDASERRSGRAGRRDRPIAWLPIQEIP